jgi:hypothetical protein
MALNFLCDGSLGTLYVNQTGLRHPTKEIKEVLDYIRNNGLRPRIRIEPIESMDDIKDIFGGNDGAKPTHIFFCGEDPYGNIFKSIGPDEIIGELKRYAEPSKIKKILKWVPY